MTIVDKIRKQLEYNEILLTAIAEQPVMTAEVQEIPIEDPVAAEIAAGRRPKWMKTV